MLTLSDVMGTKAFLTITTVLLAAAFATGASAMDISVGSKVRLSAGYLCSITTPPISPRRVDREWQAMAIRPRS